jgi:NAD(P)-dependent dehydrogenase (short-subunit alcohol dehydrogenase family)
MTPRTDNMPVAVVTDRARGIGLAIARWFLDHRHRVAVFKPILETTFEKRARVLAVDRGFEATGIGLPALRRTQNER